MEYRYEENTLVNLSSSFLKYFGVKYNHPSIKEVDELLIKVNKKKVVVLLFDGLNKYIKEETMAEHHCLRKNEFCLINSVFPPTTVAATSAFLSNKYPIENGLLGWSQYFKDLDVAVDIFSNKISKTDITYKIDLNKEYLSYTSIVDMINEKSYADSLFPVNIDKNGAKNLNDFFEKLDAKINARDEMFIYGYWPEPDHSIHLHGVHSYTAKNIIRDIGRKTKKLVEKHKDTIFFVIADHGLIDVKRDKMIEHLDLLQLLKTNPYLEPRAAMFLVKENKKQEFENLFNIYYGDHYLLMSKKEYLEKKIFGEGESFHNIENFLGDYLALSKDDHALTFPHDLSKEVLEATHSGITYEENVISVVVINK